MPSKVYVTNKGGHDYESAARYGEVVFLSEGEVSPFETSSMVRRFFPILKDSAPTDWVLLTGLTVMNVVVATIMGFLHGRINLLIFCGNGYRPRTVRLNHLAEEKGMEENVPTK